MVSGAVPERLIVFCCTVMMMMNEAKPGAATCRKRIRCQLQFANREEYFTGSILCIPPEQSCPNEPVHAAFTS